MCLHLLFCMKEQAQIWAHVALRLDLGTVWSACVCVCLLSEVSLLEGETSNVSLCLLIEVETTCHSVIYLYTLRKIMVLESIRQLKDTHFQLASSHVQNVVGC